MQIYVSLTLLLMLIYIMGTSRWQSQKNLSTWTEVVVYNCLLLTSQSSDLDHRRLAYMGRRSRSPPRSEIVDYNRRSTRYESRREKDRRSRSPSRERSRDRDRKSHRPKRGRSQSHDNDSKEKKYGIVFQKLLSNLL